MKIAFESPIMFLPVADVLDFLVGGARIRLEDIHYVEGSGIVEILLRRKELIGSKKSFLGVVQPIYGASKVETLLTIRQVVEMNMQVEDTLRTECDSCFTVLFGMKVDGNKLFLGSAEEAEGKTLCGIHITVKGIDIECADREMI